MTSKIIVNLITSHKQENIRIYCNNDSAVITLNNNNNIDVIYLVAGNLIHSFFPPLEYAFILPAIFGVLFLGGIAVFSLYHIWDFIRTKTV